MKVKVVEVGKGLHPSEIVAGITTTDGLQTLVVDKRSLVDGEFITVGYPIREDGDLLLIELPRETSNGSWRVWVSRDQVEHERAFA